MMNRRAICRDYVLSSLLLRCHKICHNNYDCCMMKPLKSSTISFLWPSFKLTCCVADLEFIFCDCYFASVLMVLTVNLVHFIYSFLSFTNFTELRIKV